ncbi:hypothetical protein ACWFRB_24730 [Rhodococcus sp. NPDC055112]
MSVTEHWSRITEWCAEHAPLTAQSIAGPASRAEIDSAQAATGAEWPDELRDLYLVQNGARTHTDSGQFLGSVLPDKFMLSLEDALERRSLMLEVWEELVAADPDFYEPDTTSTTSSTPGQARGAGASPSTHMRRWTSGVPDGTRFQICSPNSHPASSRAPRSNRGSQASSTARSGGRSARRTGALPVDPIPDQA